MSTPADPLRDKAYADFYPECDEEKSVYGIWCAAWDAALATKPAETAIPEVERQGNGYVLRGDAAKRFQEQMDQDHPTESVKPAETDPDEAHYKTLLDNDAAILGHPTESAGEAVLRPTLGNRARAWALEVASQTGGQISANVTAPPGLSLYAVFVALGRGDE